MASRETRPLRVLVADDARDIAQSLERLLRTEGYAVELAYDGAEVLRAAARFAPDVAILDIDMPQITGYDAARALRLRHPDIVLVALTGWKQATDRILARFAGFDHHFGQSRDIAALYVPSLRQKWELKLFLAELKRHVAGEGAMA